MSKFKFSFRQRVMKPCGTAQALVVGMGEDMEYGRYYTLEWVTDTGRPAQGGYYEADMLAANAPPAPGPKAKKSAKRKASRSRKRR